MPKHAHCREDSEGESLQIRGELKLGPGHGPSIHLHILGIFIMVYGSMCAYGHVCDG